MKRGGFERRFSDLIQTLPSAACERCREALDAELGGHGGRGPHAHAEAEPAPFSAFGVAFVPLDGEPPSFMIPVSVGERHGQLFAVADAFVLANEVFLLRKGCWG